MGTPLMIDFLRGNLLNRRIDMPQPYRILIGNPNEGSTLWERHHGVAGPLIGRPVPKTTSAGIGKASYARVCMLATQIWHSLHFVGVVSSGGGTQRFQ